MKKAIVLTVSCIFILGLLIGVFGCESTAPIATSTPTQSPTASPTSTSTLSPTPAQSPTQSATINWKGQSGFNHEAGVGAIPETGYGMGGFRLFEWLKEATNGRLNVELAPPGSIFPITATLDNVAKGVVPVATAYGAAYQNIFPEAAIEFLVPFAAETNEDAWALFYRYGVADILKKAYAERGIYWIPTVSGTRYIWLGSNFAATSPDTIKGKKIRAIGSYADVVAMFGGSPVNITWPEMYMAVKLGTVDGWVGGVGWMEQIKLKEVTPFYVRYPTLGAPRSPAILINMEAYNKLPADIKTMLEREAKYVIFGTASADEWMAEEYMAKNLKNVKWIDWSAEDVKKVTKQAVDTIWTKMAAQSPTCAKLIDIFKKFAKDYGRIE